MKTIEDIVHSTPCLWEYLKGVDKPIALFGMGDGADKILRALAQYDITPDAIFASDDYARHTVFRGFTVKTYTETKKELGDMVVLVAFGTQRPDVLEIIKGIAAEQELYAPDVPVAGTTLFTPEFVLENKEKFQAVYHRLADDFSKKTYRQLIEFKLSGIVEKLPPIAVPREEIFDTLLPLGSQEIYVDAGAYNGDTIQEFYQRVQGKYRRIYGIEPSLRNFTKLQRNTKDIPNITYYNGGAWSHRDFLYFQQSSGRGNALGQGAPNTSVDSIDNLLAGAPATFISYDVEGAEAQALEGSRYTIIKYTPSLWISLYHRREDLFALPLQLLEICPDYALYLRHNPYLPAWDIHLIALPLGAQSAKDTKE